VTFVTIGSQTRATLRGVRAPVLLAALLSAVALAGCGKDESGSTWDGPPEPAADGTVAVEDFNAYLADVDETWEGSATLTAGQFLRLDERTVSRTTIAATGSPEGGGPETVVVTLDGLADDSVRAERWTLELEPDGETYTLAAARRDLRCQPDRGHQDFTPEPCV
jgi:hypothetical protein